MGAGIWALKYGEFLSLLLHVNVHALKNISDVLGCVVGCLAPMAGNGYRFQSSSKTKGEQSPFDENPQII